MRPLIFTLIALLALPGLSACDPSTFFLLAPQIIDGGGASGQPFEQPRNVDALRAEMIGLINDAREAKDLIPLAPSTALHSVAQQHSNDMVAKNFLGHNGSDGSTPESRVKRSIGEAKYLGENVGAGFRTITIAHSKFMASPDNRKNILAADATQIGIGIAFGDEENKYKDGIYLTLLFFAPK